MCNSKACSRNNLSIWWNS